MLLAHNQNKVYAVPHQLLYSLALQGAFWPVTGKNSPSGIIFANLVGFGNVLVVLDVNSSPESRCLLVCACGRVFGDRHVAPRQDQDLFSSVSETSCPLKGSIRDRSYSTCMQHLISPCLSFFSLNFWEMSFLLPDYSS